MCVPTENEIVGEALIELKHEELKEMGIMSVGHRLTILKGVYEVKVKQGVPIDSDHWVPPCKNMSYSMLLPHSLLMAFSCRSSRPRFHVHKR